MNVVGIFDFNFSLKPISFRTCGPAVPGGQRHLPLGSRDLEIHKTYLQAYASSIMTTHSRIVRPSHSTRAQSHISVMWMHRPGNPP